MTVNESQTYERILQAICSSGGVEREQIFSKTRVQRIARCRMVFCHALRENTLMSWKAIGDSLNRHHSTVLVASQVIRGYLSSNGDCPVEVRTMWNAVQEVQNQSTGEKVTA